MNGKIRENSQIVARVNRGIIEKTNNIQMIQRKLQELQQQNGQQRFARYHRNDVFNQCYRQTIEECNRRLFSNNRGAFL